MKKVKIFIATHKKAKFPNNPIYIPIQVGAKGKEKFTEVTDDTKDNISQKNPNYCELTATYWIWKNDTSDIVGLTHYRRYFFKKMTNDLNFVLDKQDILHTLEEYDIIVPKKTKILKYKNIREAYKALHHIADFDLCKTIIGEKYPSYLPAFEKMEKQNSFYACNMFITSKKLFDEYHQFLFDILFELEKRIDIQNYDAYNKRIFGFLSERLFNVWLLKKQLKIKEIPVYNIDKNAKAQYLEDTLKKIFPERG